MIWRGLDAWRTDEARTLELSFVRHGALKRLLLGRRADGTWTADDCPLTNPMPVDPSFEAVLELDDDGLVVHYPALAEWI